jgi:hypothetical protein
MIQGFDDFDHMHVMTCRQRWLSPGALSALLPIVAEGELRVARTKSEALPPGPIVDATGAPSLATADFYAGGALRYLAYTKGRG